MGNYWCHPQAKLRQSHHPTELSRRPNATSALQMTKLADYGLLQSADTDYLAKGHDTRPLIVSQQ